MTANDDFPRGTVLTSGLLVNGALSSITMPGAAGIAHVLTDVYARLLNATAAAYVPSVTVNDGVSINLVLTELSAPPAAGAATGSDSDMWAGKIHGAVGASLTVAFNATAANIYEFLRIGYYDV